LLQIINNSGVNENAPPSSGESHNANVDEKAVEPSPALLLKGRGNAEVVRSLTNNHVNIPGLLASDGLMQSHLHHVQSSVQPPSTNSFVGHHRKCCRTLLMPYVCGLLKYYRWQVGIYKFVKVTDPNPVTSSTE